MFEGEITTELSGEELTEAAVLHATFGASLSAPADGEQPSKVVLT